MDAEAKILYLDLYRENWRGKVYDWAKLRPELSPRLSNKSGHLGVNWNKKSKKWRTAMTVNGQRMFLGLFDRIEDAIAARREAEMKYRSAA